MFNKEFFRRLRFYGFGFLIGLFFVNAFFKDRMGCKLPGTLKKEELAKQQLEYTHHAECRMKCRSISKKDIAEVFKKGKINYEESKVQDKPCPTYALEGEVMGRVLRIVCADCDTITRLVTVINMDEKIDNCSCE